MNKHEEYTELIERMECLMEEYFANAPNPELLERYEALRAEAERLKSEID